MCGHLAGRSRAGSLRLAVGREAGRGRRRAAVLAVLAAADRLEAAARGAALVAAVLRRVAGTLLWSALVRCVLAGLAVVLTRRAVPAVLLLRLLILRGLRGGRRDDACVEQQRPDRGACLQEGQTDDDVQRPADA